jgi:ParB family chromosome partitioning protein
VKEPLDPNVREARDLLQRALGLKVTIEDKNGRGRVIIEYSRLEDFDALMERLGD